MHTYWTKPSRWLWCMVKFEDHWCKIYRPGINLPICTFGSTYSERLGDLKGHTADKPGSRTQVYCCFCALSVCHSQHQTWVALIYVDSNILCSMMKYSLCTQRLHDFIIYILYRWFNLSYFPIRLGYFRSFFLFRVASSHLIS